VKGNSANWVLTMSVLPVGRTGLDVTVQGCNMLTILKRLNLRRTLQYVAAITG
jgi:hypothetical protein